MLQHETIGSFSALVSRKNKNAPWMVVLHGYGASADDLAPLSDFLCIGVEVNWAFLQAPIEMSLGGHMTGYAWFPLDPVRMEKMARTGQPVELINEKPAGEFYSVTEKVKNTLRELASPKDIVLSGFSQGSMVALEVASLTDENYRGLGLLSSSPVNYKVWQEKMPQRKGTRYFQSHGAGDPVLSFAEAQTLNQLLSESQWEGSFHEFQGGHEIPPNVLQQMDFWLKKKVLPGH